MTDPVGFILLSAVAAFAIVLGIMGIRRGKAVTIWGHARGASRGMFWYSIVFQPGLGIVCLVMAVAKIFK